MRIDIHRSYLHPFYCPFVQCFFRNSIPLSVSGYASYFQMHWMGVQVRIQWHPRKSLQQSKHLTHQKRSRT